MKSVPAPLLAHIAREATTLCTCWRVVRTDGVAFHFTDHDVDLVVDGYTYKARTGYKRTAVKNDVSLGVDNLDIDGVFDSDDIKLEDLRIGLFDYADVRVFIVNWQDVDQGILKVRRGTLGEATMTVQGVYRTELRGMTQPLSQGYIRIYQPECRADLGDDLCRVGINPQSWQPGASYSSGSVIVVATGGGSGQEQYENRYYRALASGTSGPSLPSFDTTVGAQTVEPPVAASDILTLSSNPTNLSFVAINGKTYTFQSTLTDVNGHVLIGATANDSLVNLAAAINLDFGAGTLYAASTTLHTTYSAAVGPGDTLTVTNKQPGANGNGDPCSEAIAGGSWATSSTAGGTDGMTWVAEQAFNRSGAVDTVTDSRTFTLTGDFDEERAEDGWFDGGAVTFQTGSNAGKTIEVRSWVSGSRTVKLFLPTPLPVQPGDVVAIYPGCDKRLVTCSSRFNNVLNFRGEPHIPGQDELVRYPDAVV